MRKTLLSFSILLAAAGLFAATTSVEEFVLDQDRTLDVAAGDRYEIGKLTGSGAFTLTKTGAGTLAIASADAASAKLKIAEGYFEAAAIPAPAICSNAFFHVDATLASTVASTVQNGTNFVSQWSDVRGADHPYAHGSGTSGRQAYTAEAFLNHRTVMDFGSLYNLSGGQGLSGWGASMAWSEPCIFPREMFVVLGDTEDTTAIDSSWKGVPGRQQAIFGCEASNGGGYAPFIREAKGSGASCGLIYGTTAQSRGATPKYYLDGQTITLENATKTLLPAGMHLIGWRPTAANYGSAAEYGFGYVRVDSFARERNNEYGGQRIGEFICFTNAFTEAERGELYAYLSNKWFNATAFVVGDLEIGEPVRFSMPQGGVVKATNYLNYGQVAPSVHVDAEHVVDADLVLTADTVVTVPVGETKLVRALSADGGPFVLEKKGEGRLVVMFCDDPNVKLAVSEGTAEIRRPLAPAVLDGAAFHVDASVPSSYVAIPENGTNVVTRWNDVRGGDYPYAYASVSTRTPFAHEKFQNGRTVMDFGTMDTTGTSDGLRVAGRGGWLKWSSAFNPVEIFFVGGDTEDAKVQVTGAGGAGRRQNTFFGHTSSTHPIFRGNGAQGETSELLNSSSEFSKNYSPLCSVDGITRTATQYRVPDGMHRVGYSFTDPTYAADPSVGGTKTLVDSFATERGFVLGGLRFGEYVVFTNALLATEREAVLTYLENRWVNGFAFAELSVAQGATLALPDGDRVTVGRYVRQGEQTGTGYVESSSYVGPTNTIGSVRLSADAVYDVPTGETLVIESVTGAGAFTFRKTGGGTLIVKRCCDGNVRFDVREGGLTFATEDAVAPSVLDEAFFHVDASDSSSYTFEPQDGTNFIARWNDVRGEGHPYASANMSYNRPFLNAGFMGGLDVVDFGSLQNRNEYGKTGWGGTLDWSEPCAHSVEFFMVIGDTEDARESDIGRSTGDIGCRQQTFFGHTSSTVGARGDGSIGGTCPLVNGGSAWLFGGKHPLTVIDDAQVDPHKYEIPDGMHVISAVLTNADYIADSTASCPVNAFARERSSERGGLRIAEYVVFDKPLTADARQAIRSYLTAKWKKFDVASVRAAAGTSVTVTDGGRLNATVFVDEGATVTGAVVAKATVGTDDLVAAESAAYDPLAAVAAYFHVDASADKFGFSATRDLEDNEVKLWSDVRERKPAGPNDAMSDMGVYALTTGLNSGYKMPFVNYDYLKDGCGLPVMDFGPIWRDGMDAPPPKRAMKWFAHGEHTKTGGQATTSPCLETRHAFVLVADHEDAKNGEGTNMSKRDQPFIGNDCQQTQYGDENNNMAYPILGRGERSATGTPAKFYLNMSAGGGLVKNSAGQNVYATFRHDGTNVNTAASVPEGFHLISIDFPEEAVVAGRTHCDAFAYERNHLLGGQRLGEVIIVSNRLTAAECSEIEALLMAKWLGGAGLARSFANVTVAPDVTLAMKYHAVTATESLTLGGTLDVTSLAAPSLITVTVTNAAVTGSLSLPATGTVTLGDAWKNVRRGTYRLIGAKSVEGFDLSGWTVVLPEDARTVRGELSVQADGVYVTLTPRGMTVIVR